MAGGSKFEIVFEGKVAGIDYTLAGEAGEGFDLRGSVQPNKTLAEILRAAKEDFAPGATWFSKDMMPGSAVRLKQVDLFYSGRDERFGLAGTIEVRLDPKTALAVQFGIARLRPAPP